MAIPEAAAPFVIEAVQRIAEVLGEQVMQVFRQQNPTLVLTPVPDAGAGMDAARAAALRRIAEQAPHSVQPPPSGPSLLLPDPDDDAPETDPSPAA